MKNFLLLPVVYIATASFVSLTIVLKPMIKKYKARPKDVAKKYQKSFYLSRR